MCVPCPTYINLYKLKILNQEVFSKSFAVPYKVNKIGKTM